MNFPKAKFINIPLSIEVDWMHGFLFQNKWGWGRFIIKKHPKIKQVFSIESELEQVKFLRRYIIKFQQQNKKIIEKNKIYYKKKWNTVEKEFFFTLSKIIQFNWPENKNTIKVMISINPICPRFLDDWSFSIFYNYKKISHALEVIMHETCHFLYFEKLKKIYPHVNRNKFDFPYIEWHLSEIIAPVILNDKRIQILLKQKAVFYSEYKKIKIEGKTLPSFFSNLYYENIYKKDGFSKFVIESSNIIRKNKRLFKF